MLTNVFYSIKYVKPSCTAFFVYCGHGCYTKWKTKLAPVDGQFDHPESLVWPSRASSFYLVIETRVSFLEIKNMRCWFASTTRHWIVCRQSTIWQRQCQTNLRAWCNGFGVEKPDRAGHTCCEETLPSNVYTSIRVPCTFFYRGHGW